MTGLSRDEARETPVRGQSGDDPRLLAMKGHPHARETALERHLHRSRNQHR